MSLKCFMSKKAIIVLSCLIAGLLVTIVVSVRFLYAGPREKAEKITVAEPSAEDSSLNLPDEKVDAPAEIAKAEETVVKPQAESKADSPAESKAETESKSKGDANAEPVAQAPKTPAGAQSFTVKNSATGKQNTLRQNADNSIELIDENGKSLWKKPLPGKICGAVAQVDHLGNGKIQYLMAEGTRLHLIDRLGREVSGFPMNLPAKAQKGPYAAKAKGQNCWKVVTVSGTVYYDKKVTKVIATAAK